MGLCAPLLSQPAPVLDEKVRLLAAAKDRPSIAIFNSAPDEFFYKVVDAQLSFQRAPDGSVKSVTLHQNGRDLNGAKQAP